MGRYLPISKKLSLLGYVIRISATHSNYNSFDQKSQKDGNLLVHYVGQSHVYKEGNIKYYYTIYKLIRVTLISAIRLSIEVLKYKARVVIIGKPHPMNSFAGIIAKILWRSILIVDIDDDEEFSNRFSSPWQKWIISTFQKFVPKIADVITTNTTYMRDKLVNWGIDINKIYYLPNGIDPERFTELNISCEELANLKMHLGINDRKVILFLGSISFQSHPIPLLLDAYEVVVKSMPKSVLLIVGGGEDVKKLLEEVESRNLNKNVIHVGKVDYKSVMMYYLISDVLVDPIYDNEVAKGRCPLKIFEAWHFQVPIITGDVGDRRMIAGEPPAIYLCNPGDTITLANGIIDVISDQQKAKDLIVRGKSRLINYYWSKLVSDFIEYLKSKDIC